MQARGAGRSVPRLEWALKHAHVSNSDLDADFTAGMLSLKLPPVLGVHNREMVFRALNAETRTVSRVRLDASAIREMDSAGLGALARVSRWAQERTSQPAILDSPSPYALNLLRSVGLLSIFELHG